MSVPRDSWIRFEGRTYPVTASRLVASHDGEGLWLEMYTGGDDDELFQSSGGLTINGLFVPGAQRLDQILDRDLDVTPDQGELELEESFFWELGETLEIEQLRLRVSQRQGNLCIVNVEARLLRHEVDTWRQIRAVGKVASVIEEA